MGKQSQPGPKKPPADERPTDELKKKPRPPAPRGAQLPLFSVAGMVLSFAAGLGAAGWGNAAAEHACYE